MDLNIYSPFLKDELYDKVLNQNEKVKFIINYYS